MRTSVNRGVTRSMPAGLVLLVAGSAHLAAGPQGKLDLSKIMPTAQPLKMVIKQPDGVVRPVGPDTRAVPVAAGEYVVARTADRAAVVSSPIGSGKAFQLPVTLATVTASGKQVSLGIVVRTGNGLMPRASAVEYDGRVYVGLVNTNDPGTAIPLPSPVQVTLAAAVDSITPDQPRFDATNTFVPVTLTARNPHDPVELHVSTGIDITETVVPISVVNASLTVVLSVPRIAGFGFETADVTVQANGLPDPNGIPVSLFLQGGGGSFIPASQLKLDANGQAVAKLRSSGVSPTVVVAATLANGTTAQAAPISYAWPIAWLAFALVGGILGGVVSELTTARKGWLPAFVVSVVVGFLAAGLYAVGVSIIPAIPAGTGGQLVVALIAALGSIAGVKALPVPHA